MTSHRPYPETIRGAWHLLPVDTQVPAECKTYDLVVFCMNNDYYQLQIKAGKLKQASQGTYTFDGDFLITRARNTDTYRVTTTDHAHWHIETKKGDRSMMRHLDMPHTELSEDQLKTLRILPIQAKATPLFDHPMSPQLLSLGDTPLALLSVDPWPEQRSYWFGVLPFTTQIPEQTWRRILHESVLPTVTEDPSAFSRLDFSMLHDSEFSIQSIEI